MGFSEDSIIQGDCVEVMKSMPDNYVSAIITDPPYGLSNHSEKLIRETLSKWLSGEEDYIPKGKGFMGKSWDSFVPPPAVWKECFRVMKPGGTIMVFAGTRTYDLMTISLRLAGFEVKETLMYMYGSGFPKSLDISKAIDKLKGAEREKTGEDQKFGRCDSGIYHMNVNNPSKMKFARYDNPATPEATLWDGYGTSLKPAYEPIILAIKPNEGSYANNALKWGVAGLNINGCRIATNEQLGRQASSTTLFGQGKMTSADFINNSNKAGGRFPANVLLECTCDEVLEGKQIGKFRENTARKRKGFMLGEVYGHSNAPDNYGDKAIIHTNPECPCCMLDQQSGISKSARSKRGIQSKGYSAGVEWERATEETNTVRGHNDKGGASRFFYCAKASRGERTANGQIKNDHPTLKPLSLMKYLVKLVIPPENGLILDPFAGSGSTCVACKMLGVNFIGIEKEAAYVDIARKRLELTEKEREQPNLF
jgi:site-specific DNA-methyltransferase (adenine-specific)